MKTKPNIPLLKRLRTRFLRMRHARHFDMDVWGYKGDRGTVACVAGHALLLAGYRLRKDNPKYEFSGYSYFSPEGKRVNPSTAARRELGLSIEVTDEGDRRLFYDRDIDTPKAAAARIQEIIENVEGSR